MVSCFDPCEYHKCSGYYGEDSYCAHPKVKDKYNDLLLSEMENGEHPNWCPKVKQDG